MVKGKVYKTSKTSNDVRWRDLGSEESTREEVGYGDDEMDVCTVGTKLNRIRNENELEGQRKGEKYPRKCRKGGKVVHVMRREYVGKRVRVMDVLVREGKEEKWRWMDSIKDDLTQF